MAWTQSQVTNLGARLLNQSIHGDKIIIQSALGCSELYDPTQLSSAEDLAGEGIDLDITGIADVDNGKRITLQINNANIESGYWLRQIGVFAKSENDSNNTLLFLMQDQDGIYIPSQNEAIDFTIEIYTIIAISNEANIVVNIDPNSYVSFKQLFDEIEKHNKDEQSHEYLLERISTIEKYTADIGSSVYATQIIIPTDGWEECHESEDEDEYGLKISISVEAAKSTQYPCVIIEKQSLKIAKKAGFCPTVETAEGALLFYAASIPTKEIHATVLLFEQNVHLSSEPGSESTYKLPTATAARLGGVKIGENVEVKTDGTISVNADKLLGSAVASESDMQKTLSDIFDSI